jgi:hypothetical protein
MLDGKLDQLIWNSAFEIDWFHLSQHNALGQLLQVFVARIASLPVTADFNFESLHTNGLMRVRSGAYDLNNFGKLILSEIKDGLRLEIECDLGRSN